MSAAPVILSAPGLVAEVDPGQGCDILSLRPRRADGSAGPELLFATPWADQARALRRGEGAPTAPDSFGRWLQRYRGGWQTLCPVAGGERAVHGGQVGFHGEASLRAWQVTDRGPGHLALTLELFSLPLRITRRISLQGAALRLEDRLENRADAPLSFDYSQHPAFAEALIGPGARLETNARCFHADPDSDSRLARGGVWDWPMAETTEGAPCDLSQLPAAGRPGPVFGWLADFDGPPQVRIARPGLGALVLGWDGAALPRAWLWQEWDSSDGFPWFRRARVVAVEPASCPTGGPGRAETLTLAAGAVCETWMTMAWEWT